MLKIFALYSLDTILSFGIGGIYLDLSVNHLCQLCLDPGASFFANFSTSLLESDVPLPLFLLPERAMA